MMKLLDTKRNIKAEPAFMRGYGDWATAMVYHNPYTTGTADRDAYLAGWLEAMADDKATVAA